MEKQTVRKTYKYKLNPTPQQEREMRRVLGRCRWLYNTALEQRITAWQRARVSVSRYQQEAELKDIRAEFPEYAAIHSQQAKRPESRATEYDPQERPPPKVRRQRQDFHHKTALALVRANDTIYHENLQPANMAQHHHLAKSISDAGWGAFLITLSDKAACAGRSVVAVNPAYPSQRCSGCGVLVQKGSLRPLA
jgi:IS605 OrfB family transposase